MIDTHAHLDFKDFDEDREEVISRFFSQNGKAIVNIGVDLEASKKSIALAGHHENIFAAVGFHPEFFSKLPDSFQGSTFPFPDYSSGNSSRSNLFEELKKLARNKKVVAIGECGLDYFRIEESREIGPPRGRVEAGEIKERQKKGFLAQINLARELGLPLIVHCREAWGDLFDIISGFSKSSTLSFPDYSSGNSPELSFTKFVLHCYSGDQKDTEKFLKLPNVYFSFSGNITYPKPVERAEKLAEAVRKIPIEKIMLDSDSPFLAPQEFRGKRNEPSHVKFIAREIGVIKGIREDEVEKITDENAKEFFGI
jgi:TatD DNase family protein